MLPECLLCGDAENSLHAGVPHRKKAIAVKRKDSVHAAVDEPLQQLTLRARGLFGAFAGGDIFENEQAALCFRLLPGEQGYGAVRPENLFVLPEELLFYFGNRRD